MIMLATMVGAVAFSLPLLFFTLVTSIRSGVANDLEELAGTPALDLRELLQGFPFEGPFKWDFDRRNYRWCVRLYGRTSVRAVNDWLDGPGREISGEERTINNDGDYDAARVGEFDPEWTSKQGEKYYLYNTHSNRFTCTIIVLD